MLLYRVCIMQMFIPRDGRRRAAPIPGSDKRKVFGRNENLKAVYSHFVLDDLRDDDTARTHADTARARPCLVTVFIYTGSTYTMFVKAFESSNNKAYESVAHAAVEWR